MTPVRSSRDSSTPSSLSGPKGSGIAQHIEGFGHIRPKPFFWPDGDLHVPDTSSGRRRGTESITSATASRPRWLCRETRLRSSSVLSCSSCSVVNEFWTLNKDKADDRSLISHLPCPPEHTAGVGVRSGAASAAFGSGRELRRRPQSASERAAGVGVPRLRP